MGSENMEGSAIRLFGTHFIIIFRTQISEEGLLWG